MAKQATLRTAIEKAFGFFLAFGLKWDRALETGSLVVGKDVEVTILVEMDKQK